MKTEYELKEELRKLKTWAKVADNKELPVFIYGIRMLEWILDKPKEAKE